MDEIEKNDFNLNISRYVSTVQAEEEIDPQLYTLTCSLWRSKLVRQKNGTTNT